MSRSTVYIILFRGVGGKTQLPTKPLREKLTRAGFDNVATYINSGNAVLKSELPRKDVVAAIARICAREFKFEKEVYALTRAEWKAMIADNPFPDALTVPKFLHLAVLGARPDKADVQALAALAEKDDRIAVVGKAAYLHTPSGLGTSKLAEKFDKGIGVPNTARNWNTVLKLGELADEVAKG